jgi:hypothetical protein
MAFFDQETQMETEKSFTLRVKIMGLALLVHDNGQTFAVFPETKGMNHCGVDPHFATVEFGREHNEDPSSTRKEEPFDHCTWRIGVPGGNGADHKIPPPLLAVQPHTRWKYPRTWLDSPPSGRVRSQLVFEAGACSAHGPTAAFDFGGTVVRLTHWIEWEIPDIPGELLHWQFTAANGQTRRPPPLKARKGILPIKVQYAPKNEREVDCIGQPANHFKAYYDLLGVPHGPVPVCKPGTGLSSEWRRRADGTKSMKSAAGRVGTRVYTCMLASADVET